MGKRKWIWIGSGLGTLAVILVAVILITTLHRDVKTAEVASELVISDEEQVPLADTIDGNTSETGTSGEEKAEEKTSEPEVTAASSEETEEAVAEEVEDVELSDFEFDSNLKYEVTEAGTQITLPFDGKVTSGSTLTVKVVVESDGAFTGSIGTTTGADYSWYQTDFSCEGGRTTWTYKVENVNGDAAILGIWSLEGSKVGIASISLSATAGSGSSSDGTATVTKKGNGLSTGYTLKGNASSYDPSFTEGDTIKITAKFTSDGYFNGTIGASGSSWQQLGQQESNGGSSTWSLTVKEASGYFEVQIWWVNDGVTLSLDSVSVTVVSKGTGSTDSGLSTGNQAFNVADFDSTFKAGDSVRITATLTSDGYFNGSIGAAYSEVQGWPNRGIESSGGTHSYSLSLDNASGYFEVQIWWINEGVKVSLDSVSAVVTKHVEKTEDTEDVSGDEGTETGSEDSGSSGTTDDQGGSTGKTEDTGDNKDVTGTDVSGTDVSGSDVSGSDVSGSDISGSDVSGSDISGSDVSGTDVSGTDVSGSDVSGTDVSGGDTSETEESENTFTPITIAAASAGGAFEFQAGDYLKDFNTSGDNITVSVDITSEGNYNIQIGAGATAAAGWWYQADLDAQGSGAHTWTTDIDNATGYVKVCSWWTETGELTITNVTVERQKEESSEE